MMYMTYIVICPRYETFGSFLVLRHRHVIVCCYATPTRYFEALNTTFFLGTGAHGPGS